MKTMGSPISGESPVEARGKRTDLDNSLSSSSNQLPLLDANSNNNNTTNFVSAAAITGPVLVPPVPLSEGVVVAAKNPKRNAGRPGGAASNNPPAAVGTPGRLRVYKSNSTNKWVTREIAALEFLLGIPMEAERNIVHQGFMQQQGLVETKHEDKNLDVLEPPNNEHSQHNNNNGSGIPSSSNHGIPSISSHGRWWEKWINNPNPNKPSADPISRRSIFEELEQPSQLDDHIPESSTPKGQIPQGPHQQVVPVIHAPGRRLEGDEAIRVQIPLTVDISVITRQRSVARMAVTREWELQVAHGIGNTPTASNIQSDIKNPIRKVHPPMLDGRLFFSSAGSYPLQVYSLLRYEPKKEEAARRRQKLEARGGGGTQFFIMPARDWRGISYRALLPPRNQHRRLKKDDAIILFDRFATTSSAESSRDARSGGTKDNDKKKEDKYFDPLDDDDEEDEDEDDEEESDTYATGLLDDPEMVQGRHRTVMIGDRVTGCIVSSTIQFVKPELLKADLNKQFRERFDGWEPPKSQRKYIGARVNDGLYTLMEPGTGGDGGGTVGTAEEDLHQSNSTSTTTGITTLTPRKGQGSTSSLSTGAEAKETIRMPPSLTLSKIRSVKQQALVAAVKAKLEISTVALAIVYFERLCLDCRVDKTNRRLSFAACLLLSIKINEAHVGLVMTKTVEETSSKSTASNRIQSLIRPTKKSSTMFASLLEFFTQEWNISLKHLFAAEWGVFAALQFRLHAKPSQVAFHFKRLLKSLDWNATRYLGAEMFGYWQQALVREEYLRQEREKRREVRQQKKEQKKLLQLQRELEAANRRDKSSGSITTRTDSAVNEKDLLTTKQSASTTSISSHFHTIPLGGLSPKGASSSTKKGSRHGSRIGFLHRFAGLKRTMSTDKLTEPSQPLETKDAALSGIVKSPSMPAIWGSFGNNQGEDLIIDIHSDANVNGGDDNNSDLESEDDGIII